MAEVSLNTNNIITAANRFRTNAEATRIRDEDRQARDTATDNRNTELFRRREIGAEINQRAAQSLRDSRNDVEAGLDRSRTLRGQQQVLDTIDVDRQLQRTSDNITSEVRLARDDQAAIRALVDNSAEQALLLDAIEQQRTEQTAPPDIRTFLSQRDQRQTLRQQQERDFNVQQRIDLRIADDNIRNLSPGEQLTRGSIVDVSG